MLPVLAVGVGEQQHPVDGGGALDETEHGGVEPETAAAIRDEPVPAQAIAGIAPQALMQGGDRQLAGLIAPVAHRRADPPMPTPTMRVRSAPAVDFSRTAGAACPVSHSAA